METITIIDWDDHKIRNGKEHWAQYHLSSGSTHLVVGSKMKCVILFLLSLAKTSLFDEYILPTKECLLNFFSQKVIQFIWCFLVNLKNENLSK